MEFAKCNWKLTNEGGEFMKQKDKQILIVSRLSQFPGTPYKSAAKT